MEEPVAAENVAVFADTASLLPSGERISYTKEYQLKVVECQFQHYAQFLVYTQQNNPY